MKIGKKEHSTEAWKEYKKSRQNVKRVISSAKEKKQEECASDLNDPNQQNEIFQIAKQMAERKDIMGLNCLKGVSDKMIVDEKGIKDMWKEYIEKVMNEENEWDHRILAGVKEQPAQYITIDEVAAAVKKMERHNAAGLSGLIAEMMQATVDIGTQ